MSTGSAPGQTSPQVEKAQQMFLSISIGRRIILVAAIIGLILSFFNWYSSSGLGSSGGDSGWHGWGILAVLLIIVCGVVSALPLLGVQSLRALIPTLPSMLTDGMVLAFGGTISVVGTILFMANEASGVSYSSSAGSVGLTLWSYLFVVCALLAAIGGFMVRAEDQAGGSPLTVNALVTGTQQAFLGLSLGRRIAVGGAVVAFVFSFLHWYSYSQSAQIGNATVSASVAVIGWHDWAFIGMLFLIIGGLVAAAPSVGIRSVSHMAPGLPPTVTDAEVVLGAGVLAILAILLFVLTEGSSGGSFGFDSGGHLSKGASYGAYVGLICGIAVAAGGYLMRTDPAA